MDLGKGKACGTELIHFGIHSCEDTKEKYIVFGMAAIFYEQPIISSNWALLSVFSVRRRLLQLCLKGKALGSSEDTISGLFKKKKKTDVEGLKKVLF